MGGFNDFSGYAHSCSAIKNALHRCPVGIFAFNIRKSVDIASFFYSQVRLEGSQFSKRSRFGSTEPPSWASVAAYQRQTWVPASPKRSQPLLLIGLFWYPTRWPRRPESRPLAEPSIFSDSSRLFGGCQHFCTSAALLRGFPDSRYTSYPGPVPDRDLV